GTVQAFMEHMMHKITRGVASMV
ncbi:hypothetical protein LCGC14_2148300, partial [marine sediment metagenome]